MSRSTKSTFTLSSSNEFSEIEGMRNFDFLVLKSIYWTWLVQINVCIQWNKSIKNKKKIHCHL